MTQPACTTRRAALLATLSTLLPLPGRAAPTDAGIAAAVEAAFRPLLAAHDIPGLAVGVTVDGQRHVACFGLAAKESGQPVTQDTLFEIGSLSKAFTATLGGLALARGAMSLADHPGRWLPQLRGAAIDHATLLHLATYTAGGLPLQFPDAVTDDSMLAYFRDWKPAAAPGRIRQYSNPSIGLFGHVAALALGRGFSELMEGEVFRALGLARSYIRVPQAAQGDYAWGYGRNGQAIHVNPGVLDAQAYGVKTSVLDLLRFVELNLRPELAGPMRQALEATHVGYYRSGELVQGLGWEQYADPVPLGRLLAGNSADMALQAHAASAIKPARAAAPATLFDKTGSTNGFGAYAVFVPARRIGLVMLANRNIPNEARVRAAHAVLSA